MTLLPNLISGVDSRPPTVAPNKAGKTTVPEIAVPAAVIPTLPDAHSEGVAKLIPSTSGFPKDPQVHSHAEPTPLPRQVVPLYTQDGSGLIWRNTPGMAKIKIFDIRDCGTTKAELEAAMRGLGELEVKK